MVAASFGSEWESLALLPFYLTRLGCHNPIQLRVLWKPVDERQNDVSVEQQSFALTGLLNVG